MSEHKFLGDSSLTRFSHRDYLRDKKRNGKEGYVVEDLDRIMLFTENSNRFETQGKNCKLTIIRVFDPKTRNNRGKFVFIYPTLIGKEIPEQELKVIYKLTQMLKVDSSIFRGFFKIETEEEYWFESTTFIVNGSEIKKKEFHNNFLELKNIKTIPAYTFPRSYDGNGKLLIIEEKICSELKRAQIMTFGMINRTLEKSVNPNGERFFREDLAEKGYVGFLFAHHDHGHASIATTQVEEIDVSRGEWEEIISCGKIPIKVRSMDLIDTLFRDAMK